MRKIVLALALLAGCVAYREPPSEAQMAAVRNGMSPAEVEQILGAPDGGTATYASGETVSGWKVPVRFAGIRFAYFNVHYRGSRVVRTSESYDYYSTP